jgi:hypothetical protein
MGVQEGAVLGEGDEDELTGDDDDDDDNDAQR